MQRSRFTQDRSYAWRSAMSSFWKIGEVPAGLAQLRDDLDSGAWQECCIRSV